MSKRVVMMMAVAAMLSGGAALGAPSAEPSQYCGGNPGQSPQAPPVKVRIDVARPAVCFNAAPFYKGAVWVDVGKRAVVVDGDSQNSSSFNRCADGYAGVHAGSEPHLMWSQGGDYDPNAGTGDGGTGPTGSGHPHDDFDTDEMEEVQSCVFTPPQ